MSHDGEYVGVGYSGLGLDKDQPSDEGVVGQGPIPRGLWSFGTPAESPTLGPLAIPLWADHTTETFGRTGFFCHGDSLSHPGQASHGCIVMPRSIREQIISSGDAALTVVD
jgi:Protein of unknown function (DUF2778)